MIPKMIHQTWRDGNIPESMKGFQKSWKFHNPDWEYRFYTDEECENFVSQEYPELTEVYSGFEKQIQRIDFFRYLVIFKYGGVYADMDMECLKCFDKFLQDEILFSIETRISKSYQEQLQYAQPYQIANCIFASEPGHWFLKKIIDKVVDNSGSKVDHDNDVEDITGPRMLTHLFYSLPEQEQEKVSVLSEIYWLPPTNFPNFWPFDKNMYSRHYFLGTWKENRKQKRLRQKWIERSLIPNPWAPKYHIF